MLNVNQINCTLNLFFHKKKLETDKTKSYIMQLYQNYRSVEMFSDLGEMTARNSLDGARQKILI